jgi:hypothetical protein
VRRAEHQGDEEDGTRDEFAQLGHGTILPRCGAEWAAGAANADGRVGAVWQRHRGTTDPGGARLVGGASGVEAFAGPAGYGA